MITIPRLVQIQTPKSRAVFAPYASDWRPAPLGEHALHGLEQTIPGSDDYEHTDHGEDRSAGDLYVAAVPTQPRQPAGPGGPRCEQDEREPEAGAVHEQQYGAEAGGAVACRRGEDRREDWADARAPPGGEARSEEQRAEPAAPGVRQ